MLPWRLRPISLPGQLRAVPTPVWKIVGLLVLINVVVWAACGITLHYYPALISSAVLSYTLGLRHALDADHISAIDLMTRRLIAAGQRPVTVGTFFSLGHSTIVIITCIVVAATSGALRDRFENYQYVGGIIGTSVSATFLVVLCAANTWILYRLVGRLREELHRPEHLATAAEEDAAMRGQQTFEGVGVLSKLFRWVFRIVDRPWKMYPVGVVFGLGFDTSSEIALLGIASLQGAKGTNIWLILIFPILFTGKELLPGSFSVQRRVATNHHCSAGMCLVDTTDGALMLTLYTSKAFARDLVAILYYSIVLTGITIIVSAFIAVIQILNLAAGIAEPEGPFWDGLEALGEKWDIIGGSICGLFLVVGIGSVLVYRPWKRKMQRMRSEVISHEPEPATLP
jgi:nickel/cobalt transporter (NiCoT) family protein